jgi:hypothetical protein
LNPCFAVQWTEHSHFLYRRSQDQSSVIVWIPTPMWTSWNFPGPSRCFKRNTTIATKLGSDDMMIDLQYFMIKTHSFKLFTIRTKNVSLYII